MSLPAHLFFNKSILLLNIVLEDLRDALEPVNKSAEKDKSFFRVGMRLYEEKDYLAPLEESTDAKTSLMMLTIIIVFALVAIYLKQIDQQLLQQGGDMPGDSAIKDHVKGLYPNLIELAYKDRNFGSRQKLSQCIRNFYQGPDARDN